MTPDELSGAVAALADKTLSTNAAAYELSTGLMPFSKRNRTLHERQIALLEGIQSLACPVRIFPPEDPVEYEAPGGWVAIESGGWELPIDVSAASLMDEFLNLGNWYLTASAENLSTGQLPDTYRCQVSEVQSFMARNQLWLLLDAFHDCTYWRIFIEPEFAPRSATA